jgi:hypothetical protein
VSRGVLEVLDRVARGCALHADECVSNAAQLWGEVANNEYPEARATVERMAEALDFLVHHSAQHGISPSALSTSRAALRAYKGETP